MKVGDGNYLVIQGWMLQLGFKNWHELAAFALVYAFSQDKDNRFQGSISYIQEWLMCKSRQTVVTTLNNLVEMGAITKEQELINGVLFNRYRAIWEGSPKIGLVVQNLDGGSPKIRPNNNIYNNISSSTTPPNNNLFDINNISEDENLICRWLKDDLEIRQLQFVRLGLIKDVSEFEEVLRDHVSKFYEQCRLDGKANIKERGRTDVISHFNNWLNAVKRKKEDGENRKSDEKSRFDDESIADMLRLD